MKELKRTKDIIKEKYFNQKLCFKHLMEKIIDDKCFHTIRFADKNDYGVSQNNPNVIQIECYYDDGINKYATIIFNKDGTAEFEDWSESFIWRNPLVKDIQ